MKESKGGYRMKKFIALLLTCCLLALPMLSFAAAQTVTPTDAENDPAEVPADEIFTFTSVADVASVILNKELLPWGEVYITPATLTTEEGEEDVYFVCFRGTGHTMDKANNLIACFLSAFNRDSGYLRLAKQYLNKYVPEGAKLVLSGHSLGGMIAQQLICTDEITERYEILNTLTYGSPYVVTSAAHREGPLVRCVDKFDVIPKFSPAIFVTPSNYRNAVTIDGGYLGDPDGAHNLSYPRADLWGGYDVFGVKCGTASLTFHRADLLILSA